MSLVFCLWILASPLSIAMVDANHNGISDLWEKQSNHGELFAPPFDPLADPDGDGWTNAQEAIAGTDPFNSSPGDEFPMLGITYIPAIYGVDGNGHSVVITSDSYLLHWSGVIGKQYTLFWSPDLTPGSWLPVGLPMIAINPEMQVSVTPANTDGSLPAVRFWRLAINDVDSDGDGFTDYLMHTDPNIADSDADGLPDLWEIAYGLDPHDNGSINPDNGSNGDKDHDGFTNLQEYLAGSVPTDANSTPATVSGGSSSTSVGAPPVLLTESVSGNGYKYGYDGFTNVDSIDGAHRRYLNRFSVVSSTEADNDGDGGILTTTETTNPHTGDTTSGNHQTGYSGQDYSTTGWIVTDDTHERENGIDSDGSGEASMATVTLSNEYTTEQMQTWAESQIPQYDENYFQSNGDAAQIILGPASPFPAAAAYNYYLKKLKYKWEVHKLSVVGGERVNWLEVFTPDDSSSPLIEPKTWINSVKQSLSPAYEIDPSQKNSHKNGTYTVIPVEFQLTDSPTNFDITGLKATVGDAGCRIVLRVKSTQETVATLHVNVFEKVEVKVIIYNVFDGRPGHENTKFTRNISNSDIEKKLNDIYSPQANLHFSVDTTLSGDLNMGTNINDPNLFSSQGEFDWNSFRQNVINKANTPFHVLPIFIVNQMLDHTKLGVTNSQETDCFVNDEGFADKIAAHEVGHYLNLSREQKGQANLHDLGPWPQELSDQGTAWTGLMFPSGAFTYLNWLRQNDWVEANRKAKEKSPN